MYELFVSSFATLFVLVDPLGLAPIFAVMTEGASDKFKRAMILKAVFAGTIILLTFAITGNALLNSLGISLMAFKTAGGILLFMIALDMVFEKRTERREKASSDFAHEADNKIHSDEEFDDISIFPMAIPFIAGPGSIAYILLMTSEHAGDIQSQGMVIGALISVLILSTIVLLLATKIITMLGQTIANAITRILGVLLAALSIQYIFDGIKEAMFV